MKLQNNNEVSFNMIDKRLIPLALGGLSLGTTEFAMMSLIPDVATSLGTTISEAGNFISAYALGVVIGAPVLISSALRFPPKKVLMLFMMLIIVFNLLSAISYNYTLMVIMRLLAGLPHGAFFGVGTVVAAQLAVPGKEAKNIAIMFTGLTVANLAMVPLVTYLGQLFSWEIAFVIISLVGVLSLLFIYLWIPDIEMKKNVNMLEEFKFLKKPQIWIILAICALGFGGLFAWLSYIAPLMTFVSGFSSESLAYIMILVGCGMVIGNFIGSVLTNCFGDRKTIVIILASMTVILFTIYLFSSIKAVSLICAFLCGAFSMAGASPISLLIINAAPESKMMGSAFIQSAVNIANSAGAYLGGVPLALGFSYQYPALVGAVLALIGFLITVSFYKKIKS